MSTVGLDGHIISTLCCGMTPVRSVLELAIQVSVFIYVYYIAFPLGKYDNSQNFLFEISS